MSKSDTTAPQPETTRSMEQARRRLCRRAAATLIAAMAETDTSFAQMASRLSVQESVCRNWMRRLMNGTAISLDCVADMAYAMGCMWEVSLKKLPEAAPEETSNAAA